MASTRSGFSMASRTLRDAFRPVADFVYPPRCPACGAGIGAQTGLCLGCWGSLQVPALQPCTSSEDVSGCAATCAGHNLDGSIIAATNYCEISRKLVLAFKHGGKTALAPLLARLIAARLGEPQPNRVIVPVPLHPLRLWRRGYNQAALLGRELEWLGHGRLLVDGLRRVKSTPSLDRRSRAERAALLASAIRHHPRRADKLRGADVLLVDDVLTSGSTTAACSVALRQAGAARITVACFAKVSADLTINRSSCATEGLLPDKTNARDHAIPGVT